MLTVIYTLSQSGRMYSQINSKIIIGEKRCTRNLYFAKNIDFNNAKHATTFYE